MGFGTGVGPRSCAWPSGAPGWRAWRGTAYRVQSLARVVLEKLLKMREGISCAVAYKEAIESTNVTQALARYLQPDTKGKGKGDHKGAPLGRPFAAEGMTVILLGDLIQVTIVKNPYDLLL